MDLRLLTLLPLILVVAFILGFLVELTVEDAEMLTNRCVTIERVNIACLKALGELK